MGKGMGSVLFGMDERYVEYIIKLIYFLYRKMQFLASFGLSLLKEINSPLMSYELILRFKDWVYCSLSVGELRGKEAHIIQLLF